MGISKSIKAKLIFFENILQIDNFKSCLQQKLISMYVNKYAW